MTFGGHFRSCNEVHPVEIEMCLFSLFLCLSLPLYKAYECYRMADEKWAKNVSKVCFLTHIFFVVVPAAAVFVDCIKLYEVCIYRFKYI